MNTRIARILLPVAFAGAGVFAAASPAVAASTCTQATTVTSGNTYARYPAYGSDNLSCVMSRGNTGEDVKALQRGLNRCYSAGLAVDGIFGNDTFGALKTAQRRAGVDDDGIYGPKTAAAVNYPYYSSSSDAFVRCAHLY